MIVICHGLAAACDKNEATAQPWLNLDDLKLKQACFAY